MMDEEVLRKKYTKCQDYQKVFSTDEGQTVLFDLMKQSSFLRCTHVPGDSRAADINEGMRNLFLYILWQLEMEPSKLMETIRFEREKDKKDKENIYATID